MIDFMGPAAVVCEYVVSRLGRELQFVCDELLHLLDLKPGAWAHGFFELFFNYTYGRPSSPIPCSAISCFKESVLAF